ncbi:hypothetical protein I4L69_001640 [Enterococcus faecium]|nr:hypothetical protein [Enterococcus faecium]
MIKSKVYENKKVLRKHRSSLEKFHAPYRGVSSKEDYTNNVLGTLHDLIYIQRTSGCKEEVRGHRQKDQDNFSLLLQGEGESATTNLDTAGNYCKVVEGTNIEQNLSDQLWTTSSGVVKKNLEKSIQIASDGKLDPGYISHQFSVKPGDILYIKLKIKAVTGKCDSVYIGADEVNSEGAMLKQLPITKEMTFFDYRIPCNQNEVIDLRLYLHKQPAVLEATTVEIEHFEIKLLQETDCHLTGLRNGMMTDLLAASQEIAFLKDNAKGGN